MAQHYHSLIPVGARVFPGVALVLLLLLAGLADAHTQPVDNTAYLMEQVDVLHLTEVKTGKEAQFTTLPTEPHCHEEYRHQPGLVLPQRNNNPNDDPDTDSQVDLSTYPPLPQIPSCQQPGPKALYSALFTALLADSTISLLSSIDSAL